MLPQPLVATCDGWTKVRQLGKGTYGVVELMERYNPLTNKHEVVAMKKLKLDKDPDNKQKQLAKAKYEFEMLQRLHENKIEGVPKYYEFQVDRRWITSKGRTEWVSYVTMEYIDGFELLDLV